MTNNDRNFTVETANGKVITVSIHEDANGKVVTVSAHSEGAEDAECLIRYIGEAINDWLL